MKKLDALLFSLMFAPLIFFVILFFLVGCNRPTQNAPNPCLVCGELSFFKRDACLYDAGLIWEEDCDGPVH